MKPAREPMRWADPGSDAPAEIAAAMRSLRAGRGSDEQVDSLGQRLAPQLAAPSPAPGGAALSPWIKLAGALLLSGAIGFYVLSRPQRVDPPASPRPHAQPAAATKAASPAIEQPAPPRMQDAPAPQRVPARAVNKPRPAATGAPRAPVHAPPPERELILLQRSQTALDRDPSASLALAEQHARDYPQGLFAQEREILAIEALLKLRRRPDALARAARFLQGYPESPHSRRVRALLERSQSFVPPTIQDRSAHPQDVPVPGGSHDPN